MEFPKGGVEAGESPREAARREMTEETGLSAWRMLDGFQESITYQYFRDGFLRIKTVEYFVAEVCDTSAITCTIEHAADSLGRWYRWCTYAEVQRLLCHARMRLLIRASRFLAAIGPACRDGVAAETAAEDVVSSRLEQTNLFRGGRRR